MLHNKDCYMWHRVVDIFQSHSPTNTTTSIILFNIMQLLYSHYSQPSQQSLLQMLQRCQTPLKIAVKLAFDIWQTGYTKLTLTKS